MIARRWIDRLQRDGNSKGRLRCRLVSWPRASIPGVNMQDRIDAVIAHPDDDAPRLAYADSCEGHDPARAEFIRLQCAVAKGGPDRDAARAGARVLLMERGSAWRAELGL